MKKNLLITVLAFFSLTFNTGVAAESDGEIGLYSKEEFTLKSINKVTDILQRFHEESPEKNIIFYIHGRGRDVNEEWRELSKFEKRFDAKIVMFHWPSWISLLVRPVEKARDSADELSEIFQDIKTYKENHPEIFANKKISLLVHSMGHIVLREYIEKYYNHDLNDSYGNPLFSNFISTGADIGLTDHRGWFAAMDFVERKFVTMNNRDLMLILSYLLDLKNKVPFLYKLGLGFDRIPAKKRQIAKYIDKSTTYIDLSRSLDVDHRYFESTKPLMLKIFKPLVNGEDFNPNALDTRVKRESGIFYIID